MAPTATEKYDSLKRGDVVLLSVENDGDTEDFPAFVWNNKHNEGHELDLFPCSPFNYGELVGQGVNHAWKSVPHGKGEGRTWRYKSERA